MYGKRKTGKTLNTGRWDLPKFETKLNQRARRKLVRTKEKKESKKKKKNKKKKKHIGFQNLNRWLSSF